MRPLKMSSLAANVPAASSLRSFTSLVLLVAASSLHQINAQRTSTSPSIDILIAYPLKPDHELIVVEPRTPVTLARSEAYDLACHFQPEVSAEWTVTWRKTAGEPFVNSSQTYVTGWLGTLFEDYQLRFNNFSSSDAGFYWCEATDPAGSTRQTSAILQVTPEIEIEGVENGRVAPEAGRDVQLACTARGYPVPTVSWTRGGVEISTTPTLLLPTISQADNGTYTCVATNRAGTAEQRADVVVVERMRWVTSPPATVSVVQNQSLTVQCIARGIPAPVIEWAKLTTEYVRLHQLDGMTRVTLNASDYRNVDRFVCIARSPYPCCRQVNTQTPLLTQFRIQETTVAPTPQNAACPGGTCSKGTTLPLLCSTALLALQLILTFAFQ